MVVVELLPRDQWIQYTQANEEDDTAALNSDHVEQERRADEGAQIASVGAAAPEDLIESTTERAEEQVVPLGRVVGVVRRNWRQYAGSLEETGDRAAPDGETTSGVFIPVERRLPCIQIMTRQRESLSRMRFLVSIDSWPANSKYPLGHYVSTLGPIGDKEVETKVVLHEYRIPFEAFSAKVSENTPCVGRGILKFAKIDQTCMIRSWLVCQRRIMKLIWKMPLADGTSGIYLYCPLILLVVKT